MSKYKVGDEFKIKIKEPKEPEFDWSKVEVDTPILVRNSESVKWQKQHFARYENGRIYAWSFGMTSWTSQTVIYWEYAKIAEVE